MTGLLLTQSSTPIFSYIVRALGWLMDLVFNVLSSFGIPSIGLSIIVFTIVIYLLMTPLTIKQQKFSKMSAKMNPEIQAIQKKYRNKKDQTSMIRMNEETKEVYTKYGTSPTGTCLPLLVQMPVLLALYRVIYAIPAYVTEVKNAFYPLVTDIMSTDGATSFIKELSSAKQFSKYDFALENTIIDVLNKCSTSEWSEIVSKFPSLSSAVENTTSTLNHFNYFLGLNIANSPWYTIKEAFSNGTYLVIIAALIIPVLAGLTQWLNVKLMPQQDMGNAEENPMAKSMKSMNTFMPLMSVYFCCVLPAGMGLYWIVGAVVRSIQQIVINKHIDRIDIDEVIRKNIEKNNKKLAKKGLPAQKTSNIAKANTRFVEESKKDESSEEEREESIKNSTEYYNKGAAKPNSLASKARMVEQYNEKNKK